MLDAVLRDARQALRGVVSQPGHALVVGLTLAVVSGAASAVLALVLATVVRPLPFPNGERLVRLYLQPPGTDDAAQRNPLSPLTFARLRERGLPSADAVEALWARVRSVDTGGTPESVPSASVSPGALTLLGGSPLVGRVWTVEEDRAAARVVVISHALWQRRFGGDPAAVGGSLVVDREPHQVVGVMPRDFEPGYTRSELWTPMALHGDALQQRSTFVQTIARLRPGATAVQLASEAQAAFPPIVDEMPSLLTGWRIGATELREAQFGAQRPALLLLLGAVIALVLLAGANLVNVMLAHAHARQTEMAVRAALGAGEGAILRLRIVEMLVLATIGITAGLVLATWTLPLLMALDPQNTQPLGAVSIDWRATAATAILVALAGGISALAPLLNRRSADLAEVLSAGARRVASGRGQHRVRRLLIAVQTMLSVVLLCGGAVLLGGFARAARVDPGFDPDHVLGAQIRLPEAAYPTAAARARFVADLLERLRRLPGVVSASTTQNPFVSGGGLQTLVHIEGKATPDGQPHTVQFRRISPGYFRTMRVALVAGRDIEDRDGEDRPLVAIVSRGLAERYWPGEDPVGRRLARATAPPLWLTVVGVASDVRDVSLGQTSEPTVYIPYAQNNAAAIPITLVIRTVSTPTALVGAIRGAVLSVDPAQPLDGVVTLDAFLADSLGPQRLRSTLLLVLAAIGLLIAAVGIYGVTSRTVHERTREVGVRMALGASAAGVWRMVVMAVMRAVGDGLVAGVAAALSMGRLLPGWLPDVRASDAWAAGPALVLLVAVASVAAAWPAWRATALDPVQALRAD